MKWTSLLSLTSVTLLALGAVPPQWVFAADTASSKTLVVAQASKEELQDSDQGTAKKDTRTPEKVKETGKPKQVGRKGGADPEQRAAKRKEKLKLIARDRLSVLEGAAPSKPAGTKKAMASDDDRSDAKKDTPEVQQAKKVEKPKEAGRGDRRNPKLRAEKRKAKLDLIAKDRQQRD